MRFTKCAAFAAICCLALCNFCRADTPEHVLASVLVCNQGPCCSGTMVSRGESGALGVSAAHCFRGNLGGEFWIYYPDGTAARATLLACDRQVDLVLFRVPAESVLAISQVPETLPADRHWSVCGYPGSKGPTFHRLCEIQTSPRWYQVDGAEKMYEGASGCGVFCNGQLASVLTGRNEVDEDKGRTLSHPEEGRRIYVRTHAELVTFLRANAPRTKNGDWVCGPWGCSPRTQAPAEPGDGPPEWHPSPNVAVYPGHGRLPFDLNSLKKRAHELDQLRAEIRELREFQPQPGEKGDKGERGPVGPRGLDFTPPPAPNVLLPLMLFGLVFAAGLASLLLMRARVGAPAGS